MPVYQASTPDPFAGQVVPASVRQRLALANALLQTAGSTDQPVYSAGLGAAKLGAGLLAGLSSGYTTAQEEAAQNDTRANLIRALGVGSQGSSASAPPASSGDVLAPNPGPSSAPDPSSSWGTDFTPAPVKDGKVADPGNPYDGWSSDQLAGRTPPPSAGAQASGASSPPQAMSYAGVGDQGPSLLPSTPPPGAADQGQGLTREQQIALGQIPADNNIGGAPQSAGGIDRDTDAAVRTVYGEAGGNKAGQQAVAAVIANRARAAGQSPYDIVHAKNQFEPWGARARELNALDPSSATYQSILANIKPVLAGQSDPTGGATFFYGPQAQAAFGRAPPSWDNGTGVDIGGNRFFKLPFGNNKGGTAPSVAGGPSMANALANYQPGDSADVPPSSDPQKTALALSNLGPDGSPQMQSAPAMQAINSAVAPGGGMPLASAYTAPSPQQPTVPPPTDAQLQTLAPQQQYGPVAAPQASGADADRRAAIANALADPRVDPTMKTALLQQLVPDYKFITTQDGWVLRQNSRTGQVDVVFKAPAKPSVLGPGQQAFNPETGQRIAGVPADSKTLNPDQRLVDPRTGQQVAGMAGGYRFLTQDEKRVQGLPVGQPIQVDPAGKIVNTGTTVNVGNEQGVYDKLMAESLAKRHNAFIENVELSRDQLRILTSMQGALDSIRAKGGTTGFAQQELSSLQNAVNSGANLLGFKQPFDISDKESLNSLSRQLAGAAAKSAVGARVTNFELENFLRANPGLSLSLEGNSRILGVMSQIAQRNIDVGHLVSDMSAANVGPGAHSDPAKIEQVIRNYDDTHHIMDPVTGQDLTKNYVLPGLQNIQSGASSPTSPYGGLSTPNAASPAAASPPAPSGAPVTITNGDDYAKLPSGALYVAPDGKTRRKQ